MNERFPFKTNKVEKRVVVSCCDSNGIYFSINYFPNDQTLIFAFGAENHDEDTLSILFTDTDTKEFIELQYLLITLGENLTMDVIKEKKLTFVDEVRVDVVEIEFTI